MYLKANEYKLRTPIIYRYIFTDKYLQIQYKEKTLVLRECGESKKGGVSQGIFFLLF